jgi:RNA polymerase sigma-70 factor (ECF subfamily)
MSSSIVTLNMEATDENRADNEAIALGLKRQDTDLLDQLIDIYQHRLMRYLLFLTGKREVAEYLFQETWMRVLLRGNQFNGKARFDTWLFTIARNLVIDLSRKRRTLSLDEMPNTTEGSDEFELADKRPLSTGNLPGGRGSCGSCRGTIEAREKLSRCFGPTLPG